MYTSFYFSFSVASPISSRHERDRLASADGHWFLRDEIENRLFYQEIDGELEFSISFCLVTILLVVLGYYVVVRMEER